MTHLGILSASINAGVMWKEVEGICSATPINSIIIRRRTLSRSRLRSKDTESSGKAANILVQGCTDYSCRPYRACVTSQALAGGKPKSTKSFRCHLSICIYRADGIQGFTTQVRFNPGVFTPSPKSLAVEVDDLTKHSSTEHCSICNRAVPF